MTEHYDVVVMGGGIVGSSIAFHLSLRGVANIAVVEKDPSYEFAATPRSNGGIRRLFSRPQNIEMASYGLEFYRSFSERLGIDADISFRRQGYMFVSDDGGHAQMKENFELQNSMGVEVEVLEPPELRTRFPSMVTDNITMAVLSDHDAWIDPYAALMGFRAAASKNGVSFVHGEIKALEVDGGAVRHAVLADGRNLQAETFVNACGAWCASVADMAGVKLPVQPMSRESYFFKTAKALEALPFVKTETDLAIRPEGSGYVGGLPNWAEKDGWNFDVNDEYFMNKVWPALATLIPPMEELKLERVWRGHYARSQFDLSPYFGAASTGPENFLLANGFSGHGIMHAPATGRALAELIVDGRFESVDLSCFSYERLLRDEPYRELGIV